MGLMLYMGEMQDGPRISKKKNNVETLTLKFFHQAWWFLPKLKNICPYTSERVSKKVWFVHLWKVDIYGWPLSLV